MPTEDQAVHDAFIQGVHEALQPVGYVEAAVVDEIASILLQLKRTTRGFDAYIAGIVNRFAEARLQEDIEAVREAVPPDEASRIIAGYTPDAEEEDLDSALTQIITDEIDARITSDVDRRKRRLIRSLSQAHATLLELQKRRAAASSGQKTGQCRGRLFGGYPRTDKGE